MFEILDERTAASEEFLKPPYLCWKANFGWDFQFSQFPYDLKLLDKWSIHMSIKNEMWRRGDFDGGEAESDLEGLAKHIRTSCVVEDLGHFA